MSALDAAWRLADEWPVERSSIAVVHRGEVETHGDICHRQRIASISKPLTGWAVLVAAEEGSISLDDAVGQTGCTVRHLLAHAGGYGFDGVQPIGRPASKRIYSNTGFEMLAEHVEHSTGISFTEYLDEAVFSPLGMVHSALEGSCAKDVHSTVEDLVLFIGELRNPALIARETWMQAVTPQFPELSGVVPGIGSFDPCPWGLGLEIKGHKEPHWTATHGSASTYGHFGGIGTFLWIDPVADVGCVMLAEREFDEWGMQHWPAFNDAVLAGLRRQA